MTFDPRLTPARPDLAARHLQGVVTAERFVEGTAGRIVHPTAPVRATPDPLAPLTTEALYGEAVTVYEITAEGWAWGQLAADSYVGWLPSEALAPAGPAPTHKVSALRTPVFPGPSIKLPPIDLLSFGSRLVIASTRERFAVTAEGGFVFADHLVPLDAFEADVVAVAARYLGAAYLWGGRSSLGLDCSGLVQAALTACGHACLKKTQQLDLPTRHRHAGESGGGRSGVLRRSRRVAARRSALLARPCRHHRGRRDAAARDRAFHVRGARTAGTGAGPHRGQWHIAAQRPPSLEHVPI